MTIYMEHYLNKYLWWAVAGLLLNVMPVRAQQIETSDVQVRRGDYFPESFFVEVNPRLSYYLGFRGGYGKRLGAYASVKLTHYHRKGFNADECGDDIDLSTDSFQGRIRSSYIAGIRYGIPYREFPIYAFCGIGYGEKGVQRSNGLKGKEQVYYYNNYSRGFESELGASFVLFDFISLSCGANVIFDKIVAFDLNIYLGFAVNLTD